VRIVLPTCVLRPLELADAPSLARHANDRDIWLNVRDRFPHPYSPADAESYISLVQDRTPVLSFGIIVDSAAAGGIGLMPGEDVERTSAEIGYWLGREFRGRGIATDAVRAVTTYAFDKLGFTRVFAVPFAHNPASARVLHKAGYIKEGMMRRSAVKDGVIINQGLYAAYDDTWDPSSSPGGG
jgi:ribosomal-protein-alanine N-acetyltransferase